MMFFDLRKWLLFVLAGLAGLAAALPAGAVLKVDINKGTVDPLPIAITDFLGAPGQASRAGTSEDIGARMAKVISANLERSGLFRPISPRAFVQAPSAMAVQPRFADWRVINAEALVTGKTSITPDGRLRAEFRLWDVFAEVQMTGLSYTTPPENWRRIAHMISDAIYERLTGEKGYFDSRIVYIAESGDRMRRVKRLAMMDQDGENHVFLTDGRSLVLTPRFSPSTQEITYLSYQNNRPRVYLFNVDTRQQEVLGDFPGMTFSPRFSSDGNKVIMSLARDGNSDVYVMDLRTRRTSRLTDHPAIDTSPSFSPDDRQIVFNSDRGGSQQLYVMNAQGGEVKRISFGDGKYATPAWSPRGDLIAFTKIKGGSFFIGVMRPDGTGERLLTESFLDEGPTWSPNGRIIMFYRQEPQRSDGSGGRARLRSIDITGYNEREVLTPTEGSDPAWSPLLR